MASSKTASEHLFDEDGRLVAIDGDPIPDGVKTYTESENLARRRAEVAHLSQDARDAPAGGKAGAKAGSKAGSDETH